RQVFGLIRPSHGRERPEPRAEPGVKHIGILLELGRSAARAARRRLARHHDLAALPAMPGRDAMAPPTLPRHAPVADVVHPLEIRLAPILRDELDASGFDGLDGPGGQRLHLHEPLRGDERLDYGFAALAFADAESVGLDLLD